MKKRRHVIVTILLLLLVILNAGIAGLSLHIFRKRQTKR